VLEPRTPGEHDAWLEQQREEEERKAVEGGATADPTADQTATESGKTTRTGRSRKPAPSTIPSWQRSFGRATDIPPPPPIPAWFLEHNVMLLRDTVPEATGSPDGQIVRCVDRKTGHTLFTVPYYPIQLNPGSEQASRKAPVLTTLRGKEVDVTVLGIDAELLEELPPEAREEVIIDALIQQRAMEPNEVDLDALAELLVSLPTDLQHDILRREKEIEKSKTKQKDVGPDGDNDAVTEHAVRLGDDRNNRKTIDWRLKLGGDVAARRQPISIPDIAGWLAENFVQQMSPDVDASESPAPDQAQSESSAFEEGLQLFHHPKSYHPMSWIFLEAESSIRAALTIAEEGNNASSFASSRVDVSLYCPDAESHEDLDHWIRTLATVVNADVIRIDANDIEDLAAEYVGQGKDEPGAFATLGYDVYHGYEAASSAAHSFRPLDYPPEDDMGMEFDEYDEYDEEESDRSPKTPDWLRKVLFENRHELSKVLNDIKFAYVIKPGTPSSLAIRDNLFRKTSQMLRGSSSLPAPSGHTASWDDVRLGALLESLLNAAQQKRSALNPAAAQQDHIGTRSTPLPLHNSEELRAQRKAKLYLGGSDQILWTADLELLRAQAAEKLVYHLASNRKPLQGTVKVETSKAGPGLAENTAKRRATVVHLQDLKDISRTRLGDAIIRRLVKVVQKRRSAGERIVVVGTSAQEYNSIFTSTPQEPEDYPFRTVYLPPFFKLTPEQEQEYAASLQPAPSKTLDDVANERIFQINLRHLQSMLRRLRPVQNIDLCSSTVREQMALPGTHILTEKILSFDQVQRLVLTAIGLAAEHAKSDTVQPVHIALATYITSRVDHVAQAWSSHDRGSKYKANPPSADNNAQADNKQRPSDTPQPKRTKADEVRDKCNPHETRLLTGVADAKNIKVGFADVHAPSETIEALKTLTTLSLLRPDAFSYGVLANDRLPGLLLYGPPGTGKTLLAKAVAKESRATVLEVSGAQVYEKYVGEGEKMVRAVFSLAKKLSPCVVFIDEADAIFGSRSGSGNRNTHREIMNQFLREWDGMEDHSVFMMVATNRPFDLDDAVLRRLPRRLLVDLPVAKDRESILRIHLKGEALDPSVNLNKLAEQTPYYSGSDLKNLCVAAALAAVREENDLAAQNSEKSDFKLPEKRTLHSKHFEKAMQEISASISEDMASLTAIRKFDEQYGDRRGRRKKTPYGFGMANEAVDENAVRVRHQDAAASPVPPPLPPREGEASPPGP
jgi:ATP-dependent 26S proteasome regulatory subunit